MIRHALRATVLALLLLSSGCESSRLNLSNLYAIGPLTKGDQLSGGGLPEPMDLGTFRFLDNGAARDATSGDATALGLAIGDASGFNRDRLKAVLVGRSDLICNYNKAQIAGTADSANFALGEAATVLGVVGSIVTAATPARVLAGLSGLSTATRTQVAETFYQNAVKFAILQRITDLRAGRLDAINSYNGQPLRIYSVESMMTDVREYHNTCSFFIGVDNLSRVSAKTQLQSLTASGVEEPLTVPATALVPLQVPPAPLGAERVIVRPPPPPRVPPASCPAFPRLSILLGVPDASGMLDPAFAPAVRRKKLELGLVPPGRRPEPADSRVDEAFCRSLARPAAGPVNATPQDAGALSQPQLEPRPGSGVPAGPRPGH